MLCKILNIIGITGKNNSLQAKYLPTMCKNKFEFIYYYAPFSFGAERKQDLRLGMNINQSTYRHKLACVLNDFYWADYVSEKSRGPGIVIENE